jgi:hypothetical protein
VLLTLPLDEINFRPRQNGHHDRVHGPAIYSTFASQGDRK